jgi:hypothetical protein
MMIGRDADDAGGLVVEGKEETGGSSGTPSITREASDKKVADLA